MAKLPGTSGTAKVTAPVIKRTSPAATVTAKMPTVNDLRNKYGDFNKNPTARVAIGRAQDREAGRVMRPTPEEQAKMYRTKR